MKNEKINQLLLGLVLLVSLLQAASANAAPFTHALTPQPQPGGPTQQQNHSISAQGRGVVLLSAHDANHGDARVVPFDEDHEGYDSREPFEVSE
jgi:hypothetical protein